MQKNSPPSVSVHRFLDAREFLRRAYEAEKKAHKGFSHRYIAKAMGAGSSSFFKDILLGRVPITPARAAKFAKLFRLPEKEAEHFETLVLYTQAETPDEKERLLRRLHNGVSDGRAVLEAAQAEYLAKRHYAAVRELLAFTEFRGGDKEYAALAALLDPPITAAEARDAIDLLLRLKLVRKTAQGLYEKADKVVVTGPKGDPAAAKPGIRANIELALRSLDAHEPADRPFSYLTLSVSPASLRFIGERLRDVRREILERVSEDEDVDRLVQLNMQLFPISKVKTAVAKTGRKP
jgi:uncharacterized protein (TIGR02147 family)